MYLGVFSMPRVSLGLLYVRIDSFRVFGDNSVYRKQPYIRSILHTVKCPKFGNGTEVRHPLSKPLINHKSLMIKARAMVQKSKYLHIFFLTKKVRKMGGHH